MWQQLSCSLVLKAREKEVRRERGSDTEIDRVEERMRKIKKRTVISTEITAIQRRKSPVHARFSGSKTGLWELPSAERQITFSISCVIPSDVIQGSSDVTTMLT